MTGRGTILFGGSGFLGPYILNACPEMISVGRSQPPTANRHIPIESLADLSCLEDVPFDRVIYIIGNTDHHHLEQESVPPGEPTAFEYHVTPLLQTLEQLKRYPIKQFIHFSTVLIYDEQKIALPVSEDAPIDPYRNRYVLSKYLAEEASKFYARWLPITTVRLANLYGPTPLARWDLIHRLCHQLLDSGRADMWSVKPARDFIYVEDAARAVVKLLESDATATLNLGSGTMTSVSRVREVLEAVSGGTISVVDQPVSGPTEFQCDTSALHQLIDWTPRYSIEDGIRATYETMKSYRGL